MNGPKRETQGVCPLAGLRPVNKLARSWSSASLLTVGLLLGLGSCAARVPDPPSEAVDPASAGRLRNCPPGTADCDRNPANACETALADDPKNCGSCGVQCAAPNGDSSCLRGTCRMIFCIPGHCDLDGDPKNGCESRTKGCRVNKE